MSWVSCFSLGGNKICRGKPLGNRPLQRSRHLFADNMKMELEINCWGMICVVLIMGSVQWWIFLLRIIKLKFIYNKEFLK
jgi:hypothetical protein